MGEPELRTREYRLAVWTAVSLCPTHHVEQRRALELRQTDITSDTTHRNPPKARAFPNIGSVEDIRKESSVRLRCRNSPLPQRSVQHRTCATTLREVITPTRAKSLNPNGGKCFQC